MTGSWWCLHALVVLAAFTISTARPFHTRQKRDEEYYPEENTYSYHSIVMTDGLYPPRLVEGDIVQVTRRRNAVRNFHRTWVNRTVPYVMDEQYPPSFEEQRQIVAAMAEIMENSCVHFVPRTKETDYIRIVRDGGCFSSVGRTRGAQPLYLAEGCYHHGVILHELMHALGFWHEHSRPDRDRYITIIWSNINVEHRSNFEKYGPGQVDTLNTTYDYGSIMHYRNNTFAIDRSRITINHTLPLPPGVEMGQRVRLSHTDILKLLRLYKCNISQCQDPGVPRHGVRHMGSVQVGSSLNYTCEPGYMLYGSRARYCLDQGYWTGNVPFCLSESGGQMHQCNFDGPSLCGWKPDPTSDRNWTLHFANTPSNGTGPVDDHTLGTAEGWYIYLEASGGSPNAKARITSPNLNFPQSSDICMMFYYNMHGKNMGTLNVYHNYLPIGDQHNDSGNRLFSVSDDHGEDWKQAFLELPASNSNFSVTLEAVEGASYLSDIAVDDVIIAPCSALMSAYTDVAEDTFRCDFNAGMCGMEQEKARDHFDWTRRLNETPSLNTGPACDPLNCVSGYYVYTEASSPRKFGDTARLLTPVLHGEGGRCVTFYWNMNGNGMGNLTVKLHRLDGTEDILWFRTGHQNNTWRLDTVSITRAPRFYRLVFEGSIGISYRSDMAIDNIDVRVGECAVANANCNFTTDLCGWRNTAALLWQRFTGDTGTPNTGPSADRNNSTTGYYLYVESSRTSPHEVARLEFERLSGNVCLQFWYHMFGRSVGTLSLLTRPYTSTTSNNINDNTETRLWEMTGDQGRMWHRHSANLTSAAQHFTVIFEAKMMGGNEGDMAIDDIEVHSGLC